MRFRPGDRVVVQPHHPAALPYWTERATVREALAGTLTYRLSFDNVARMPVGDSGTWQERLLVHEWEHDHRVVWKAARSLLDFVPVSPTETVYAKAVVDMVGEACNLRPADEVRVAELLGLDPQVLGLITPPADQVILVAFNVRATDRAQAQRGLMDRLPRPDAVQTDEHVPHLVEWWIAEDDRLDNSDNESAVFCEKGQQPLAGEALDNAGIENHNRAT